MCAHHPCANLETHTHTHTHRHTHTQTRDNCQLSSQHDRLPWKLEVLGLLHLSNTDLHTRLCIAHSLARSLTRSLPRSLAHSYLLFTLFGSPRMYSQSHIMKWVARSSLQPQVLHHVTHIHHPLPRQQPFQAFDRWRPPFLKHRHQASYISSSEAL